MRIAMLVGVFAMPLFGCSSPAPRAGDLWQQVRQDLAAAHADSDAAVILGRALDEAAAAKPDGHAAVLEVALKQADEARRFTPHMEAPLSEGWPAPSLPGLIRIKSYPSVRAARVQETAGDNRQFMTLFRHIQDRHIAMTAPVVMGYPAEAARQQSEAQTTVSMAFLYRQTTQDAVGQFGTVQVEDEKPLQVVSIGLKGSYAERNFQAALANLRDWLKSHPEWAIAGAPRVLAYNSPFLPFWMKYAEVQIPVRADASQTHVTSTSAQSSRPTERAIFAGGCFWGVDYYLRHTDGVLSVTSGYTGGRTAKPTHEQVSTGTTGHAEAVEVVFDPARVTYETLARLFFEIHDPTEVNRQGPDVGTQYRSAVFCLNEEQKQTAERLIALLRTKGYKVATEVAPASTFWPAADYDQDYIDKHPERVCNARVDRFGQKP